MTSHTDLGTKLDLFMFHPKSPGSCFFLKHGTRIYNTMTDMLKQKYKKYSYDLIMTPNIACCTLWEKS